MFWDRRKKDRREKKAKETPDRDRRVKSEKTERRQWACGILYKTSIPVTELEAWLDANADGRWAVALEGIGEELSSKVLKIMFEDHDDKNAFVEAFSRRQR
ncbi:MAG: hypothetical protein K0Q70_820 [Rhodospirillales bacterium]|jgi:hypothetical protein|nr:hypothetical protein [Rhodospirillales bacterium]